MFNNVLLLAAVLPALIMPYRLDPRRELTARDIRLRVSYFNMQCYRKLNVCSAVITAGVSAARRTRGKAPDAMM